MTDQAKKTHSEACAALEAANGWVIARGLSATSKSDAMEKAAGLFMKASNQYRDLCSWSAAANCMSRAAECYKEAKYNDVGYNRCIMDAVALMLRHDPKQGLELLERTRAMVEDERRVYTLTTTAAAEYEKLGDRKAALVNYAHAADLVAARSQTRERCGHLMRCVDLSIGKDGSGLDVARDYALKILALDPLYTRAERPLFICTLVAIDCCRDYVAASRTLAAYRGDLSIEDACTAKSLVAAGQDWRWVSFRNTVASWPMSHKAPLETILSIATTILRDRCLAGDFC